MSFKKYVFSMLICAVTMFVMIFNAFVPVKSYADDSGGWAIDWFGTDLWTDKKNNLQSEDVCYLQVYYNRMYSLIGFSIPFSKVEKVSLNEYYDKITLTFDNVPENGYFINNYVYSSGIIVYSGRTSTSQKVLEYTSSKNMSYSSEKVEEEDTSFFGRLEQGLKDLFMDTLDADKFLLTGDILDYLNKNAHAFSAFVRNTLGITGDTLKDVMEDIYNNDYSEEFWTGVDNQKIKQIQGTSNNMRRFWYDNITVVNDNEDGSSYHYEIKNYNPVTNTYPDYFYNENYFYENILYKNDTDLDDTNNWLQKIYNAIIDLPNHVKSTVTTNVTNTYNYLFTPSDDFWNEWDLKFSNTLNDKFPVIKQVEDFTKNVGDIINSYSEEDFAVGSINSFFAFDNDTELEVQTFSLEDDISNVETSYTGYIPKISIDLSQIKLMGYPLGDGKVIVMDFTWYLKYRPLIFTLIIVISYTWYIISLGKSLPRLIGNVADVFDYRQDVEVANSINEYNESEYYFSELAKNSKE